MTSLHLFGIHALVQHGDPLTLRLLRSFTFHLWPFFLGAKIGRRLFTLSAHWGGRAGMRYGR